MTDIVVFSGTTQRYSMRAVSSRFRRIVCVSFGPCNSFWVVFFSNYPKKKTNDPKEQLTAHSTTIRWLHIAGIYRYFAGWHRYYCTCFNSDPTVCAVKSRPWTVTASRLRRRPTVPKCNSNGALTSAESTLSNVMPAKGSSRGWMFSSPGR